jgi:hypothetical protein
VGLLGEIFSAGIVDAFSAVVYVHPCRVALRDVFHHNGRKKEKTVKKTALLAVAAAAGLATSVYGQNAQVEIRIVVDGTMGSPFQAGSNFFPQASASNPIPTAVGLTIQARVRTTGTFANWGISRAGFVSGPSSWITHNDTLTNTTSAQWTDVRNAFNRGATGDAGSPAPRLGLFNYFRNNVTTAQNIASGNGTFVNTFNNGLMQTGAPNASNNWVAGAASGSNFGGIVGVDGNVPLQSSSAAFQNFTPADATSSTVVDSGWQSVYRFLFIPRTNTSDPNREVLVRAGFRVVWATLLGDVSGVGDGPFSLGAAASGQQDTTIKIGEARFLVPTPGAAALLGLGGLAVARRRRA